MQLCRTRTQINPIEKGAKDSDVLSKKKKKRYTEAQQEHAKLPPVASHQGKVQVETSGRCHLVVLGCLLSKRQEVNAGGDAKEEEARAPLERTSQVLSWRCPKP